MKIENGEKNVKASNIISSNLGPPYLIWWFVVYRVLIREVIHTPSLLLVSLDGL